MSVNIPLSCGKLAITTDAHNWMLCAVSVAGPEAKVPGEVSFTPLKFRSSFDSILRALFERRLRSSDARTLEELRTVAENAAAETCRIAAIMEGKDPGQEIVWAPTTEDEDDGYLE